MQITVPESVFHKAERLALNRGFASVGAYVAELVVRDEAEQAPFPARNAEVEAALLVGLSSSTATPLERSDWDELRRRVQDVHLVVS